MKYGEYESSKTCRTEADFLKSVVCRQDFDRLRGRKYALISAWNTNGAMVTTQKKGAAPTSVGHPQAEMCVCVERGSRATFIHEVILPFDPTRVISNRFDIMMNQAESLAPVRCQRTVSHRKIK